MTEYRDYKIDRHPGFTLYMIKPKGKGSVPKVLTGWYTSIREVTEAIDKYLSLKEKEKANGKKANTARS